MCSGCERLYLFSVIFYIWIGLVPHRHSKLRIQTSNIPNQSKFQVFTLNYFTTKKKIEEWRKKSDESDGLSDDFDVLSSEHSDQD